MRIYDYWFTEPPLWASIGAPTALQGSILSLRSSWIFTHGVSLLLTMMRICRRIWVFTLIQIGIRISFPKRMQIMRIRTRNTAFKSRLPEGSIHYLLLILPRMHSRFSPLIRDLHERACHHGTRKSAKTGWTRWRFVTVAKSWEGFLSRAHKKNFARCKKTMVLPLLCTVKSQRLPSW